MKRRFVETRKILAVAPFAVAAAAAGCGASASSEGAPVAVIAPPAQPEPVAATPPTLVTPPVPATPPASTTPAVEPQRTPGAALPSRTNDPALLALRAELARETRGAVKDPEHYRPLCDKDGFPLVGNVMRKAVKQDYQPSELCAELRAQAKR